jgi:hypothetical protein
MRQLNRAEYEAGETLEARCARDAALATASAKQMAHEAIAQNRLSWLERAKQSASGNG